MDAETAVKLYTREAAKAAGFSGSGMLKKGYRADFAVLSGNIFKISPEQIELLQVMETYIRGYRQRGAVFSQRQVEICKWCDPDMRRGLDESLINSVIG